MSALTLEVKLTLASSKSCLYVFERPPVLVGRGASCELCVPLKSISSQHLSLNWGEAQGLVARDLNAKNKAEHQGRPLTGEISDPCRLTLALPGALLEARLVPARAKSTSSSERNQLLRELWSAADGWLLEWHTSPTDLSPLATRSPEQLIPLPFGERLELRASLSQAEGLPRALLESTLSVESGPWGVTVTSASGERHTLKSGEQLETSEGLLSLPPSVDLAALQRRRLRRVLSVALCLALSALIIWWLTSQR